MEECGSVAGQRRGAAFHGFLQDACSLSSAIPIARTLVVPFGLLLLAQHAVPLLQELAATHGTLLTVLPYLAAALPLSTALLLQRSRAVYLAIWLALGGW